MSQTIGVYRGTGRRKCAVARVRLIAGSGKVIINGRPGPYYLQFNPSYLGTIKAPLEILGMEGDYDTLVVTSGGGLTGQTDAIRLGVARALCTFDQSYRKPLKTEGYLSRDARVKERQKYGLHKARKAPQFSKR